MALIDQRILIPAPMATVWEILSDHTLLPQWRVDCQAVSILSTHRIGQGVRRRITPKRGKDFLEDFKAWYNGFGYEYQIVDSKTYKYNLTRLRLQATPDGTIVQWTIEYDIKGFWSRLLGSRRRRYLLEKNVIDSLRELRRYVVAKGIPIDDDYRTKAGVQDAPDVQKRAAYGAQLFSQVEATEQVENATGENKAVLASDKTSDEIAEPPVRIDDTPSIPLAPPPSFITSQFDVKKPAVDESSLPETSSAASSPELKSDTQPNKAVQPQPPAATPKPVKPEPTVAEPTPAVPAVDEEAKSAPVKTEAPQAQVKTDSDDKPNFDSKLPVEMKPPVTDEIKTSSQPITPAVTETPKTEEKSVTVIDKQFMEDTRAKTKPKPPEGLSEALAKDEPAKQTRDTDQMSIWDVFGVARPAELDEGPKPSATPEKVEPDPNPSPVTMSAPPTTNPQKIVVETPDLPPLAEPEKTTDSKAAKKELSIDELLALEEPPLPSTASASVKTIVRQSTKSIKPVGLRKQQSRQMAPVRSHTTHSKATKDG